MHIFGIIWPTLALVALIWIVWFTLIRTRLGHIKANPPTRETFASGSNARAYFEPVQSPADNLANLFEMPVLYFALVPLLILTHHANVAQVTLAWIFVGLRAAHSLFHVTKRVRARFVIYLVSCAILLAMWIGFGVDLMHAAQAYDAAMANMV